MIKIKWSGIKKNEKTIFVSALGLCFPSISERILEKSYKDFCKLDEKERKKLFAGLIKCAYIKTR